MLSIFQKYSITFFLLCHVVTAWSQNLVRNPSFESYRKCPEGLGNLAQNVEFWTTPTLGSTDYFNGCSETMGTPENFNGKQPADFGFGYAGLYLYAPDDYREYVQVALTETLTKGKKYRVSFYISLAERSDFAVKEFGLLFVNNKIDLKTRKALSKKLWYQIKGNTYSYLEIGYTNFYADTKDWIPIHTEFEAKGTEKYLIIGNFKNNARTRLFKTKRDAKQGAYYYLDKVEIKTLKPASGAFEIDTVHTFNNLLFPFDSADLIVSSISELHEIYDYLEKNPELNIVINGYTDDRGSLAYNKILSTSRAKSVADYLIGLGLETRRVQWEGHGSKDPVAENGTDLGRQQNRRVAFRITR